MAHTLLYFAVTFFSCIVGALGGIGGGIIIKPALDFIGEYSLANIGILSSITVLTMTVVSIGKMRNNVTNFSFLNIVYLAIGSIVGGILGSKLFFALRMWVGEDRIVGILQSVILIALVLLIVVEELMKDRLKQQKFERPAAIIGLGLFLGLISSFLGIGGGPFNKPALYLFLGFDTKGATVGSLSVVFFSQVANVVRTGAVQGFTGFDFTVLPYMMLGAVVGGYIGGLIVNQVSDKLYDKLFLGVLAVILCINVMNLTKYFMA